MWIVGSPRIGSHRASRGARHALAGRGVRDGVPAGTLVDVTLSAVLFDMDGTLIDSEKLWDIALRDLGASLGGALSATARAATVGTSGARTMRIIQDDLGLPSIDLEAASLFLGTRMVE